MEPKFQSSFIPKGPLATTGTVTKTSRLAGRSILGTLAALIFSLSVLSALAVVGLEWYLKRDIRRMGAALVEARATLEPEIINKISALDNRIVSTKRLLDNHTVLSPLFAFLEDSTVRTVRFSNFEYNSAGGELELNMRGEAVGYSALALQSEIFNASPYMKDIVFGDLSLDSKGMVNFSLKAKLDPSIISFNKGAQSVSQPETSTPPVGEVVEEVTPQTP